MVSVDSDRRLGFEGGQRPLLVERMLVVYLLEIHLVELMDRAECHMNLLSVVVDPIPWAPVDMLDHREIGHSVGSEDGWSIQILTRDYRKCYENRRHHN